MWCSKAGGSVNEQRLMTQIMGAIATCRGFRTVSFHLHRLIS
jgi:hypothetical protein